MVYASKIKKGVYKYSNYASALWAMYKAGEITYKRLMSILKKTKKEQARYVKRNRIKGNQLAMLKKQVRAINQTLKHDLSMRTYRQRDVSFEGSAVNTKEGLVITGLNTTLIETALANLRYWNESAGTWVDATPTTTASQEMTIKRVSTKCVCRNNYQVPCMIEFYCCVPKDDTSINPYTAFTNGMTDQDNPSSTSSLLYLTDSDQFNDLWKIKNSVKKYLDVGEEVMLSYSMNKPFQYDPSLVDSHALEFQSKYAGHAYVVRVSGIIAHDSAVTTERGFTQSGVDVYKDLTVKVEYDSGGPSLNDFVVLDNSSTFTNGAVVSNKPVADNQGYSLA